MAAKTHFFLLFWCTFIGNTVLSQKLQSILNSQKHHNTVVIYDSVIKNTGFYYQRNGIKDGEYLIVNDTLGIIESGLYRKNRNVFTIHYQKDTLVWHDSDTVFFSNGEYKIYFKKSASPSKNTPNGYFKIVNKFLVFKGFVLAKSGIKNEDDLNLMLSKAFNFGEIDSVSARFYTYPIIIDLNDSKLIKERKNTYNTSIQLGDLDMFDNRYCRMDDPNYRLIDTLDDEFSIFQDVLGNFTLNLESYYYCPSASNTRLLKIVFVNRFPKFIQIGEECMINDPFTDRTSNFVFSGDLIHLDNNNKILQRYRYKNGCLVKFYLSEFNRNYLAKWNKRKLPVMLNNGTNEHCPVFYDHTNGGNKYYPEYSIISKMLFWLIGK